MPRGGGGGGEGGGGVGPTRSEDKKKAFVNVFLDVIEDTGHCDAIDA